ncbi:MAG: hypothetical protein ACLP52_26705 [Streptosporangiaceae bacterium]
MPPSAAAATGEVGNRPLAGTSAHGFQYSRSAVEVTRSVPVAESRANT